MCLSLGAPEDKEGEVKAGLEGGGLGRGQCSLALDGKLQCIGFLLTNLPVQLPSHPASPLAFISSKSHASVLRGHSFPQASQAPWPMQRVSQGSSRMGRGGSTEPRPSAMSPLPGILGASETLRYLPREKMQSLRLAGGSILAQLDLISWGQRGSPLHRGLHCCWEPGRPVYHFRNREGAGSLDLGLRAVLPSDANP